MAEKHSSKLLSSLLKNLSKEDLEKTRVKMNLSARIADELSKRGLNQKKFAESMGKSPSEVSKWLSGTHNFTTDTLVEICSSLGIEINTLFEDRNVQTVIKYKRIVVQGPVEPKLHTYYNYTLMSDKTIKHNFLFENQTFKVSTL